MHFILGLAIAAIVLWAWLGGNQIVRLFVFLLLSCIGALFGTAVGTPAILAAPVIAWFVAGLPTYYHQYRQQPPPLRWPNP
jgi:hypothetical protein